MFPWRARRYLETKGSHHRSWEGKSNAAEQNHQRLRRFFFFYYKGQHGTGANGAPEPRRRVVCAGQPLEASEHFMIMRTRSAAAVPAKTSDGLTGQNSRTPVTTTW